MHCRSSHSSDLDEPHRYTCSKEYRSSSHRFRTRDCKTGVADAAHSTRVDAANSKDSNLSRRGVSDVCLLAACPSSSSAGKTVNHDTGVAKNVRDVNESKHSLIKDSSTQILRSELPLEKFESMPRGRRHGTDADVQHRSSYLNNTRNRESVYDRRTHVHYSARERSPRCSPLRSTKKRCMYDDERVARVSKYAARAAYSVAHHEPRLHSVSLQRRPRSMSRSFSSSFSS